MITREEACKPRAEVDGQSPRSVARHSHIDAIVTGRETTCGNKEAKTAAAPQTRTIRVHVSLKIHGRGGRRVILTPDGSEWRLVAPQSNTPLLKALARAFRWRKLLEDGTYATVAELAAAEKINASYVSRVLRLTLLAPKIIDQVVLAKASPADLRDLIKGFPIYWPEQHST